MSVVYKNLSNSPLINMNDEVIRSLEFLAAFKAALEFLRKGEEELHTPTRLRTISTYAPEPASVIATKGQILKGLLPGVGLGPLSPVA